MTYNTRLSGRALSGCLSCAVLLALAACAKPPAPGSGRADVPRIVFPEPPDEARFVYERTIRGSADVAAAGKDVLLKPALTGEESAAGSLSKPFGVAVHHGRVFVSDMVVNVVQVFVVPEGRHFSIGGKGYGQIGKPAGLAVDGAGNLYVADTAEKSIMIYDRDGNFLRRLGGAPFFDRLGSVAVDNKGERIYAVDIGGAASENHRIRIFDARTGKHLFDFGKRGNGPGEFNLPRDVAIGKDGRLYVVDNGNFRIQIFDAGGRYLKSFGKIGIMPGDFAQPKDAAADAAGNLYVTDTAYGNIQIFDSEGNLLMFIGGRSDRDGPASYNLLAGIFVDEDGRIYVTDQWFGKVDVFRPAALGAQGGYLAGRRGAGGGGQKEGGRK